MSPSSNTIGPRRAPSKRASRKLKVPGLFQSIVETVSDAIVTVDERQVIVLFNRQAERTFGYSAREAIGQPIELLLPEAFREARRAQVASFRSQESTRRRMGEALDLVARGKDGNVFPVEVTISKFERDGAKLFTAVVRDVTAQRQVEVALKESTERFRAHFKNSPLRILAFQHEDGNFRIVDCNDAALEVAAGQAEKLLGRSMTEFWADRPDLVDMVWRCFRERIVIRTEIEYQYRSTLSRGWLALSLGFVPPDIVMVSSEDITDRIEKEREIRHLAEELEQRVTERTDELRKTQEQLVQAQRIEAVGSLAGGVAHDFNNLLTIIQGRTESLKARMDPQDPDHRSTEIILNATARAAKLTEQLLAFGRKQVRRPGPLNLRDLLEKATDLLQKLGGPDVRVATDAASNVKPVWADPGQIEEVVFSLVKNACEAMPDGGCVTVEAANVAVSDDLALRLEAPSGAYVKLAVRDDGVGMDRELQTHIFEPFYSKKPFSGKGHGLSLSAVYGIVKQSGGYIDVDSAPGRGSCFTIYLPEIAAVQPAQTLPFELTAPSDSVQTNRTILLAEDEDDVREMVADFLRSLGYDVLAGADGTAALRAALNHPGLIDLLLTDVVMPLMDGPALAEHMTREQPGLKVLFMTGYAPESERLENLESRLGRNASLLRKPFSLAALGRAVSEQFGHI